MPIIINGEDPYKDWQAVQGSDGKWYSSQRLADRAARVAIRNEANAAYMANSPAAKYIMAGPAPVQNTAASHIVTGAPSASSDAWDFNAQAQKQREQWMRDHPGQSPDDGIIYNVTGNAGAAGNSQNLGIAANTPLTWQFQYNTPQAQTFEQKRYAGPYGQSGGLLSGFDYFINPSLIG